MRQAGPMDLARLLDAHPADRPVPTLVADDVEAVAAELGGASLSGGLYRWHDTEAAAEWTVRVADAFPAFAGRIRCFAADWLGSQFALDSARLDDVGAEQVLMFDIGAGEVLEVPAGLRDFHEEELVEEAEAAVASEFYEAWREASGDERPLRAEECVAHTVPMFRGGEDSVDNLARTDASAYWARTVQMMDQTG